MKFRRPGQVIQFKWWSKGTPEGLLKRFYDEPRARSYLDKLASEPAWIVKLRRLWNSQAMMGSGVIGDDNAVLDGLARALVTGKLKVGVTAEEALVGFGGLAAPSEVTPIEGAKTLEKLVWIEIELRDELDRVVPGEKYRIKLPDGSERTGSLDGKGFARIDGIVPGTCEVTFPRLDQDMWAPA